LACNARCFATQDVLQRKIFATQDVLLTVLVLSRNCHTYGKQAMRGIAKDKFVLGVKRGGSLSDYFHIAKPGFQGSLHVFMAPLLDECRLPPAYIHSAVHGTILNVIA
jgi:hypothetical protein